MVTHTFPPIYANNSKALILGTMPSPKSRENGFYYGHPQNRFWRVLADVLGSTVPVTVDEKKRLLLDNKIAIWDVLHSCDISGADDNSIKKPIANDFTEILANSEITAVFTTGRKAESLYMRLCYEKTELPAIYLPSTSPANTISFERLAYAYSVIRNYLC